MDTKRREVREDTLFINTVLDPLEGGKEDKFHSGGKKRGSQITAAKGVVRAGPLI